MSIRLIVYNSFYFLQLSGPAAQEGAPPRTVINNQYITISGRRPIMPSVINNYYEGGRRHGRGRGRGRGHMGVMGDISGMVQINIQQPPQQ